jgi:hypothetical protein
LISSESCASDAAASRQSDRSALATTGEAANDSAECGTATSHNCRALALTFFQKSFESALNWQISAVQVDGIEPHLKDCAACELAQGLGVRNCSKTARQRIRTFCVVGCCFNVPDATESGNGRGDCG